MKEIERILHDEKCDYQEVEYNRYDAIANRWSDAICGGCDKYSNCRQICAEFDAIIRKELAK